MYNLLLHTTDDHFLKVVSAYQRFCTRGASQGICGVCGETGLEGKGKPLSLTSARYFILRGDEFDDSLYGRFKNQLRVATNAKEKAINQLC